MGPPFECGQRVQIIPASAGFHALNTGMEDIYSWLNAPGLSVTGAVLRCEFWGGSWVIGFRPDGWPLPEGVWPGCALISAACFSALAIDAPSVPAPIVDGRARPVSAETLAARVELYVRQSTKGK